MAETKKKPVQMFFCDFCQMQFSGLASLERHKKEEKHMEGSKATSSNANVGIYVTGYSEQTKEHDLVKYFSQFGNIIWAHFGYDFVLFDFTDPKSVEKVMSKNGHFLQGSRLVVRHKETKNRVPTNDDELNEKLYESITNELNNVSDFEQELEILIRKLISNPAAKCQAICHDLLISLHKRFPKIRIHPFGSSITGLALINSDIDVYLANVKEDDNEKYWLHIIKKLLSKSGKFGNCFVIATAKTPLIKCVHLATKLHLDINLKNMLGVCNSELIRYYISIGIRVTNAMIVLKYWCRVHKITGQNHLLTNYSLMMMFIFFLQVKYNLPSVQSLQSENPYHMNVQGYWNGGFLPNYQFRCFNLTRTPTLDLLLQFFDFYLQFPFQTSIICPYLGSSLPRTYFDKPLELPSCFNRYKQYINDGNAAIKTDSVVCLQDPFELSRNITAVVVDSILERFLVLCKMAKEFCEGRQGVLYKMLTEKPVQMIRDNYTYKDDFFQITLQKSLLHLVDDWFDVVINFLMTVFKDFFLMDVTEDLVKKSKTDNQSDIHEAQQFKCTAMFNMWQSRKTTAKELNLTGSSLVERELAVTKHLKQLYAGFKNDTAVLSFTLTVDYKGDEVVLGAKKISAYKKSFKSFAMFVAVHLPVWFELFVKELKKDNNDE